MSRLSPAEEIDRPPAAIDSIKHDRPVLSRRKPLTKTNHSGVPRHPNPDDLHGRVAASPEIRLTRTLRSLPIAGSEPRREQDAADPHRVIDSRRHVRVKPGARSRRIQRPTRRGRDRASHVPRGADGEHRQHDNRGEPDATSPRCAPACLTALCPLVVSAANVRAVRSPGALQPPSVHVRLVLTARTNAHRSNFPPPAWHR